MNILRDMIDRKFNRLTIVRDSGMRTRQGGRIWECKCICGNSCFKRGDDLVMGRTKSCGCLKMESDVVHGHVVGYIKSKTYTAWCAMIQRCTNENTKYYNNYGGRGIEVCDRWREDFRNFLEDMGECPNGMTLERIDNDREYCKENCKWATQYEQHRNMRTNIWVEFNDEQMIITDAIKLLSITNANFYRYMRRHNLTHQQTVDYYVNK